MHLFEERGVVLFDAAMGSALLDAGQPKGTGSEEMNNSSPETVLKIHLENIQAGSDVVTSNTFGITGLMLRGDRERALGTLVKAVGLAKKAATGGGPGGREVLACLCVGPSGMLLGPLGDIDYDVAEDAFAAQAEAACRAGADFILLETFADPEEFASAARGAKKAVDLPVLGTMTFGESGRSFMGASPEDLIRIAREEKLSATGANCSLDPAGIIPVMTKLLSLADGLPLIAQPNMGQPVYDEGKVMYVTSDEAFVAGAKKLIELGVSGIGGCCGTTPMVISLIRDIIDRR